MDNISQITGDRDEFLSRAKIIFKVFSQKLGDVDLNIRAITTLATLQDIKSYPDTSVENVIFRAGLYSDTLLSEIELILSMPSNEERLFACMTLFYLENKEDEDEELLRDQDQEIEGLIEDFVMKEIERVIWSSVEPSLLEKLVKEMKRIISQDKKVNLSYVFANIAQLQKELHKAVTQLKTQSKKITGDLFKKQTMQMLTSFTKQLEKRLEENKVRQKNITKTRRIRSGILGFLNRRMLRVKLRKVLKKSKRVSGRQELFDLLTAFEPLKQLKLKKALGGDQNIIKEVKCLVQTGMSAKSASVHLINKHDISTNKASFQESLGNRSATKSKSFSPVM
jgi:hypothetical protein